MTGNSANANNNNNSNFAFQNSGNVLISYSGNYAAYIKNFTQTPFYGVNVAGYTFTLNPEVAALTGMVSHLICGIEVSHYDVEPNSFGCQQTRCLGNHHYKAPCKGYPLYIPEMNIVLFESDAERTEQLNLAENNASKLINNYASGLASVVNGSHTSITVLNKSSDKRFYMLKTAGIEYLPNASEEDAAATLKKFNYDPEILEAYYVFVITTTIKNTSSSTVTLDTDIKKIAKSKVSKDEPLIMDSTGIVIFDSREGAEDFQKIHGSLVSYLSKKSLEVTAIQHSADLDDVNEQAKKDKKAMLDTFMIMGGTSIASILTENVIKVINSPDSGQSKAKQVLMIGGIGAGAIISIIGIYNMSTKLKSAMNEKKKEAKGE